METPEATTATTEAPEKREVKEDPTKDAGEEAEAPQEAIDALKAAMDMFPEGTRPQMANAIATHAVESGIADAMIIGVQLGGDDGTFGMSGNGPICTQFGLTEYCSRKMDRLMGQRLGGGGIARILGL